MIKLAKNAIIIILASLVFFSAYKLFANDNQLQDSEVKKFITEAASHHNLNKSELQKLFAQAQIKPAVLAAIQKPYEAKPWDEYKALFLTPDRIKKGVKFWQAHGDALSKAEQRYGVPSAIIVAIIGIESYYGANSGKFRVIDALTTLAFHYPPRAEFFKKELINFLLLTKEQRLDPLTIKGSYAGAIGIPQFMPSSYRAYAINFSGDDSVDLNTNYDDAIGSIANYLKKNGWQPATWIVTPASIKGNVAPKSLNTGLKFNSLQAFKASGVIAKENIPPQQEAVLITLITKQGPEYWLGSKNFYTITRYNTNVQYAMAVAQLAKALTTSYEDLKVAY